MLRFNENTCTKNLNFLCLSVSRSFFVNLMPPLFIFRRTVSIYCPTKTKITQYCFCGFQQHFTIFFLIIIEVLPLSDNSYGCHSAERISVTGICKNVFYAFAYHCGLSLPSELNRGRDMWKQRLVFF